MGPAPDTRPSQDHARGSAPPPPPRRREGGGRSSLTGLLLRVPAEEIKPEGGVDG